MWVSNVKTHNNDDKDKGVPLTPNLCRGEERCGGRVETLGSKARQRLLEIKRAVVSYVFRPILKPFFLLLEASRARFFYNCAASIT